MTTYEFVPEAGDRLRSDHQPAGPLAAEPDAAAAQLKERLHQLELTCDHFHVAVDGTTAIVSGDAAVQEQKEKILLAVGNVVGVARVEDRITVGQEGLSPRFVTVRAGETLVDIAERIYGDAAFCPRLLEANRPLLSGMDQVYPGQVLRAPVWDTP
ncbi:peptidoglycan-binding protein LysM [Streptomyces sp. Ru73]|uniref:peptidoglycan-binding protein LysM n=1 Tax=Streptomyces sp. Ru73 TaxID=2080748 RepID=UPI000CDD4AD1|nr:peptidoglycan-binding protein LysM [Streptomyces sp. Ru73]POX42649.1 peptidoglycan-binding protein LysM [Streptomyces sp. Ru73]